MLAWRTRLGLHARTMHARRPYDARTTPASVGKLRQDLSQAKYTDTTIPPLTPSAPPSLLPAHPEAAPNADGVVVRAGSQNARVHRVPAHRVHRACGRAARAARSATWRFLPAACVLPALPEPGAALGPQGGADALETRSLTSRLVLRVGSKVFCLAMALAPGAYAAHMRLRLICLFCLVCLRVSGTCPQGAAALRSGACAQCPLCVRPVSPLCPPCVRPASALCP